MDDWIKQMAEKQLTHCGESIRYFCEMMDRYPSEHDHFKALLRNQYDRLEILRSILNPEGKDYEIITLNEFLRSKNKSSK